MISCGARRTPDGSKYPVQVVAPAVSPEPAAASEPSSRFRGRVPARLPVLLRSSIAVLGGALIYLSAPPRTLWWLAPLGFALIAWVLHERTPRAGFGYGVLAGLGYLVPLLAWTGVFVGPVAWLPLSLFQSLFIGLVGLAIAVVSRLPGAALWSALLWVAGELLRSSVPFGGFPWGKIAFSQPEGMYLPLAAVAGTPLIAFAVALTGFGADRRGPGRHVGRPPAAPGRRRARARAAHRRRPGQRAARGNRRPGRRGHRRRRAGQRAARRAWTSTPSAGPCWTTTSSGPSSSPPTSPRAGCPSPTW